MSTYNTIPLKVNTDHKWSFLLLVYDNYYFKSNRCQCANMFTVQEKCGNYFLLDNTYIITTFYHCRCDEDKFMSINTEV